jgi:hypothetical protein
MHVERQLRDLKRRTPTTLPTASSFEGDCSVRKGKVFITSFPLSEPAYRVAGTIYLSQYTVVLMVIRVTRNVLD